MIQFINLNLLNHLYWFQVDGSLLDGVYPAILGMLDFLYGDPLAFLAEVSLPSFLHGLEDEFPFFGRLVEVLG